MKDIYNSNPCGDIHVTNWIISLKDKFEDTKGLIRSGKSKKDRQYNGQQKKDKKIDNDLQKNYTENKSVSYKNITKKRVWTQVLRKGYQFQLH